MNIKVLNIRLSHIDLKIEELRKEIDCVKQEVKYGKELKETNN